MSFTPPLPDAVVVDELNIEELPRGAITRLFVRLVHDGLGQVVAVPLLVARGEREGPTFGLTCAVHGNELNGIPVVHRLFDRIDLKDLRGVVAAVLVANVPAYHRHQRWFSNGADINHLMPGRPDGNVGEVYVYRLFDRVISRFNLLVDMHTASTGRINSLYVRADMTDPVTAQMAYLQRPQIIVHNPPADGTLRGAAMYRGIPAITVEIGNPQRFQPDLIKRSLVGLRSVLAETGMLSRRGVSEGPHPVLCTHSYWIYTDHGGMLEVFPNLTDEVEENAIFARLTNVFGDVLREYRAPESGVVIGKNVDPVAETGSRLLHLGIVSEPHYDGFVDRDGAKGALGEYRP